MDVTDVVVSGLQLSEDYNSTRDRLSELHDSLIHFILSFLEMGDVVRTTLLSKRWNNLWTTLPFLQFRPRSYDSDLFKNFVNRALESWKGTKILKLRLDFMFLHPIPYEDLDSWLLFAIEKQVEDLCIDMRGRKFESHQRLYSCSSLRKLLLFSLEFKAIEESRVHCNQLKSLSIDLKKSLNIENVMNKVICGAPLLEILDLSFDESNDNLNIESTSLKMLKIHRYVNFNMFGRGVNNAMLRISAPNLETLEIFGRLFGRCLWNVPCLTNADLNIARDYYGGRYSGDKLLEMRRVFLSIRSVEKLKLSAWCFKVLEDLKKKDKVVCDYDMFPKLKKMLIKP